MKIMDLISKKQNKNNGDIELLRAGEVAEILKIKTSTVYRLMQIGEIPSIRFGKSVRVERSILIDWIKEKHKT